MNLDQIYNRYMTALDRVTGRGVWMDTGAVRLALQLALDDAHAAGSQAAQRAAQEVSKELDRLTEYLVHHGHADEGIYNEPAGATIACAIGTIGRLVLANSHLDNPQPRTDSLAAWLASNLDVVVDGETPMAQAINVLTYYHDKCTSLEDIVSRKDAALAAAQNEAAMLRSELEILKAAQAAPVALTTPNGNGKTAPALTVHAMPLPLDPGALGLSPMAAEYWEGCARGTHPFRKLPLEIRLEMIQAILRLSPPEAPLAMTGYDSMKPDWMPMASGLTKTFGCSWLDLPALTPDRIKAAA